MDRTVVTTKVWPVSQFLWVTVHNALQPPHPTLHSLRTSSVALPCGVVSRASIVLFARIEFLSSSM